MQVSTPRLGLFIALALAFLLKLPVQAHVGHHPSVHDTVAGVIERMKRNLSPPELRSLSAEKVEKFLTPAEREILGTEHVLFRVNVPVRVSVVRGAEPRAEPFWLKDRGFQKSSVEWIENKQPLTVWEKDFETGWIGLGVNSLTGGGTHYLVVLHPKNDGDTLQITDLYPGQLRTSRLESGVKPFVDRDERLTAVPEIFRGQWLVQTQYRQRDDARLQDIFRFTEHPALARPDQITLTWSGDPKTTQAIQWRTSEAVKKGLVRYQRKAELNLLAGKPSRAKEVRAKTDRLESKHLVNDPIIHHHTAVLDGLDPGTSYVYSVGDGSAKGWSEPAEFTTAPSGVVPFSFIYMGDAQNGLDRWGTLLKNAYRSRPDAAFYIMAGDLVNRGADRDDWDSLFYNAKGVYDRRQLVPVIGNHECQGGYPGLYLKFFDLPDNGPAGIENERAYAFEYSNALFVVLDSNLDPESQTQWLEEKLAGSSACWKFVTYHHPAYSSVPQRDNKRLRELWTPVFDKYHVDLALQGHDHAYLRTYPMKDQKRVGTPAEGTVYIVSVSGTKMYAQDKRDYTEFGMTNVATYQILDIQISGDRLVYRAYDIDGKLRDELVIEKPVKR